MTGFANRRRGHRNFLRAGLFWMLVGTSTLLWLVAGNFAQNPLAPSLRAPHSSSEFNPQDQLRPQGDHWLRTI
jgi:hypothetical protein